jgi:hypothetical protein
MYGVDVGNMSHETALSLSDGLPLREAEGLNRISKGLGSIPMRNATINFFDFIHRPVCSPLSLL